MNSIKHIGVIGNVMHPTPHDSAQWVNPLRIYATAMVAAGASPDSTPLVFPSNLTRSGSFIQIRGSKMAQAINMFT